MLSTGTVRAYRRRVRTWANVDDIRMSILRFCLAVSTFVFSCLSAQGTDGIDKEDTGCVDLPADLRFEPEWRQKGDCGRCALYILMRLEGRDISMSRMKSAVRVDPDAGCSMADLSRAANELGFPVEIRFVTPKEMAQLPCPYILHWNGSLKSGVGHFAVITGFSENLKQVHLIDAQFDESRSTPEGALARSYSGYVLVPIRGGYVRNAALGSFSLLFLAALIWFWRR